MNPILLDKNKRYLVAVSGGPDSMALLHMLIHQGYGIEVAHVNYHLRESSNRDQAIVEKFCEELNIPLHLHNVLDRPQKNTQNWARQIRYKYFAQICHSNGLEALLTAHHLDDHVESYYLQKKRQSKVDYFGIQQYSQFDGVKIIRPLLGSRKSDLQEYCVNHDISFGIDETNYKLLYARNRVRVEVTRLSEDQFRAIVSEIENQNHTLMSLHQNILDYIQKYPFENGLNISSFLKLSIDLQTKIVHRYLDYLMNRKSYFKEALVIGLVNWIATNETTTRFGIRQFTLIKENGLVIPLQSNSTQPITQCLSDKGALSVHNYTFSWEPLPNAYRVYVNDDDFPLTVCAPAPLGSRIVTHNGHKKVSRVMIDKKIPIHHRATIPVVMNRHGLVIGIVGFYTQARLNHMQRTLFVLK